ncbi:MAG: hypothetical protein CMF69_07255 [Magnetovibrio sp.]|mgnify:FL=1|nr:hypothetical protein [Magnetovibrio sp.]|tara:strand:- start:1163 stop:1483 length:321 start_codon:yes stop_codon:yes gene_type:complete
MCEILRLAFAAVFVLVVIITIPTKSMGADKEYGQYLSAECNACHAPSKKSGAGIPSLNGKPVPYLVSALLQYKNKSRKNAVMQMIAGRLDSEQINALAAYFSSLGK